MTSRLGSARDQAAAVRVEAQLVRASGLTAGFGASPVLSGVDLQVAAGETVAIVGRSGCGKTTLLHALAGLQAPTAGTLEAQPAALMPQRDGLMPWASARDNAALPLRIARVPRREARSLADAQLRELGLGDALGRPVGLLSGGMRQRVALARTLLTGRRLLLLDEPLAAVDALTRGELHQLLLRHLARDGHGAVLVTHDLDEAAFLADRLFVLAPVPESAEGPGPGHAGDDAASVMRSARGRPAGGTTGPGPSTLLPGPALLGQPGQHLDERGGQAVRDALLTQLAA
ncbi:MAG: ATP-binding cassette domain-containing protein [Solirubrobacteraceae bacterium]|nr:ATP-binding cassette domain-containing protein [Solirubrobacteraceae bacterium]